MHQNSPALQRALLAMLLCLVAPQSRGATDVNALTDPASALLADQPQARPKGFTSDNPMPYPDMDFLRRMQIWFTVPTVPQDIDPKLFDSFWRNWELVTTRYKPDGEEIRFIYVNAIGADALAGGKYPFPAGTVLAKIGAHAVHDSIFPSSLVPGDVQRVQIMLKNPEDPNAREGWVYSLYTPSHYAGHLSSDEIDACHACHVVARTRDMVFAQPFPFPVGAEPRRQAVTPFKDGFRQAALGDLEPRARDLVAKEAPDAEAVMLLTMPAFSGTLFESREVLAAFARSDNKIYVLDSPTGGSVLLAIPRGNCIHMVANVPGVLQPHSWDACANRN